MVGVAAGWNIYTVAIADIDADMLRAFIEDQREQKLLAESLTLELKAERRNDRVVRTVAGFANNIGGILLLGVAETNPHFDTSPGVDVEEPVSVIEACRSSLEPTVIPEVVPVRIPDTEKVVLVVRVDQDPTLVPVTSNGKVWIRAPGQTIGATRDQIRMLCSPAPAIAQASGLTFALDNLFRPEQIEALTGGETCDFVIRPEGCGCVLQRGTSSTLAPPNAKPCARHSTRPRSRSDRPTSTLAPGSPQPGRVMRSPNAPRD